MTPFGALSGQAVLLDDANIDTDQIIPARFLRRPRGDGYGAFLFHDRPAARAAVQGAAVLLAGANFGCGSSREGAVYALIDAGLRCVVAPSFADIFAGNAAQNGLLTVVLPASDIARLPGAVKVDLAAQVIAGADATFPFEIDPFRKRCLLEGLDDIGLTLDHADAIASWERSDRARRIWAAPAG